MTASLSWGGKFIKCCVALAPWLFFGASQPGRAPASLIAWRDEKIAWILQPKQTPNGPILSRAEVAAKCAEVLDELHAKYGSDLGVLHRIPGADEATSNFVRFVTGQHWLAIRDADGYATHLLGGSQSDLEYSNSIRPYVMPWGLLADQTFLQALQTPKTYYKALDMIAAQNRALPPGQQWLTLTFRAQFILSVDATTRGRLLVVIPRRKLSDGSEIEQWFQFALAAPETPVSAVVRSVSCIARVSRPDGHTDAYFIDLYRKLNPETGEIGFQPTYELKPMPSSDCFSCHKTAILPIYPKSLLLCTQPPVKPSHAANASTDAINALMMAPYGPTSPPERTLVNLSDYGPSLGSGDLDSALASQAPVSNASAARIRAQMTCTKCHGAFAPLNYEISVVTDRDSSAFESKRGLAQTFVENGYMPPGNDLTPNERKTLWQALSHAYFDPKTRTGAFVDWLQGK